MQVPAHFEYERATSLDHALQLLASHGEQARVIAGGHSLIPMMKLRLAEPEVLIDINGVTDLAGIAVNGDGLTIGAMTRHADLLASDPAARHAAILRDAERVIADPVVRNHGTVGGSLCQADPSEDLSAVFAALRATAVIQGPGGRREVPVREFHLGAYETALAPEELLVAVRVPALSGGGSAYAKVERRAGDWAIAAAGAVVRLAADGTVAEAGIGLAAVGAEHFTCVPAEDALRGHHPDAERIDEAARIVTRECAPVSDQRGPADYKRHLAGELTARALRAALARATATEG